MKQKFFLNVIVLFLVGTLVSCSKEKADNPPVENNPGPLNAKLLVKTNSPNGETVYEYFPDRKIKTITETSLWNPVYRTEFTHAQGSVTLTEIVNNKKTNSWTYLLDNKGLNTGVHYKQFNANGDIVSENISACTYNAAGQLIKEDFGGGSYDEFIYANGILIQYNSFVAGQQVWESKYEYYTDKAEKLISCGQFNSRGLGGIRSSYSKYLIKRKIVRDPSTQAITFDAQYTYEFDNDGFVTKGKYVNSVGGGTHEWTNTFQ